MLEGIEKKFGLPPIREVSALLGGINLKRLDSLLAKVERLSKTSTETLELLRIVQQLDKDGTLARLEHTLTLLPKGKDSADLLHLLKELGPRLDKLTQLADALLKEAL